MVKPISREDWYAGLGHHEIAEYICENILDIECVNLACWLRDFYPEKFVEWAQQQKWYQREITRKYEAQYPEPDEMEDR